MTEITDKPTTRPAFLRRAAVTLGAAVGIAAVRAQPAHAVLNCCRSDLLPDNPCQGIPTCTGQDVTQYYCTCPEEDYCICKNTNQGNCQNGPC
jgi:hypothetical protein